MVRKAGQNHAPKQAQPLDLGEGELVNEQPTHLDLFSGIGGFALAAGWAGFRTIGFCEIEPYCQAVLKKHWPQVPIHPDIRKLRGGGDGNLALLTGGFPCQPFSVAGKRRGKEDHRHLWQEMLRVIKEARPAWVLGENVVGIVNMELDQVCSDLEAEGYAVWPLVIPACAVDAPHRRDRVWILANTKRDRCGKNWEQRGMDEIQKQWADKPVQTSEHGADVANAEGGKRGGLRNQSEAEGSHHSHELFGDGGGLYREYPTKDVSDNQSLGTQGFRASRIKITPPHECKRLPLCQSEGRKTAEWNVEPIVGRVANGIRNRSHRIKGLGNAIVPQVAYQIIKGIKEVMDKNGEN